MTAAILVLEDGRTFSGAAYGAVGAPVAIVAMAARVGSSAPCAVKVRAAALGLIAFVPFVGLAVLPLQLLAWVFRGVVFQFLGLTSVGAYLRLYRSQLTPAPTYVEAAFRRPSESA